MSEHIASELSSRDMDALRAALVDGVFSTASGDLGRAVMAAYVMWHDRVGALATVTTGRN